MKREWLALCFVGVWVPGLAAQEGAQDLLTRGKLEADSGDLRAAAATFLRVADDSGAPAVLRGEALVRLGLARRQAGDRRGATQAFARAWDEYGAEKETRRLVVEAVYGSLPGSERWDAIWQQVALKMEIVHAERPEAVIQWPDAPQATQKYTGAPVWVDCTDCELLDVVRKLVVNVPLSLVVHPSGKGAPDRITLKVRDMPWDEALDHALAPNGLVARRSTSLIEIGRPGQLDQARTAPSRVSKSYNGSPISLDLADADLSDVFRLFADVTQLNIVVHPGTRGRATIRVKDTPWDEALDLVLRTNGLAANHVGNLVEIGRAERLGTPRRFSGGPIDFEFQGADIRDVLRDLAARCEKALVIEPELDRGLRGKVTLMLRRVPCDQAFDVVVRLNGMVWRRDGPRFLVERPAAMR